MKVNWKEVAKSEGYLLLKKQYVRDCHEAGMTLGRPMRDKNEFLRLFKKIIDRAKSRAIRTNTTIESVLLDWSIEGNSYWWLNSYTRQINKLPSGKPSNVQPISLSTYYKSSNIGNSFRILRERRIEEAKTNRKNSGKKARWSPSKKRQAAKIREYEKSL